MSLSTYRFAGSLDPGPFHKPSPGGQEPRARACEGMVPVNVYGRSAPVTGRVPAAAVGDGEGEAQAPPQGDLHFGGGKGERWFAGRRGEPGTGSGASLRPQEGLVGRPRGRQQLMIAEV